MRELKLVFLKIWYFFVSPGIIFEKRIIDLVNSVYSHREKELKEEIKIMLNNYHNQ